MTRESLFILVFPIIRFLLCSERLCQWRSASEQARIDTNKFADLLSLSNYPYSTTASPIVILFHHAVYIVLAARPVIRVPVPAASCKRSGDCPTSAGPSGALTPEAPPSHQCGYRNAINNGGVVHRYDGNSPIQNNAIPPIRIISCSVCERNWASLLLCIVTLSEHSVPVSRPNVWH